MNLALLFMLSCLGWTPTGGEAPLRGQADDLSLPRQQPQEGPRFPGQVRHRGDHLRRSAGAKLKLSSDPPWLLYLLLPLLSDP